MMPIDVIINGTNCIINQNRGEESMNAVIKAPLTVDTIANVTEDSYETPVPIRITIPEGSRLDDGPKDEELRSIRIPSMQPLCEVEFPVTKILGGIIAAVLDAVTKTLRPIPCCYEGSIIVPVNGSCEIVILDNTKSFADVSESDWYTPAGSVTRAQAAAIMTSFARNAK